MYAKELEKVEAATEQLNTTRAKLWMAQDELREAQSEKQALQQKVEEMEENSAKNQETIKVLQDMFNSHAEEKTTIQESYELLRKGIERSKRRIKEDDKV